MRTKISIKFRSIPSKNGVFMSKYVGDFHRGTGFVCFDSFLIMNVLILLKFPF